MKVSNQVLASFDAIQPVVALESALISHGMEWPANLEIARELEGAVREAGAEPATIALMDGQVRVGLTSEELEAFARAAPDAHKISTRDLPLALAQRWTGGTTVAATMRIAHLARIKVFATGGIGGVTRGVPHDVSADLEELRKTPVMVVCAGAKSILDLPATLEVLETHGVPVVGYRTDELPAFFARTSGLKLSARAETPAECAAIFWGARELSLLQGCVIAQPAPEAAALVGEQIEEQITQALREAEASSAVGAALTPFVLKRVAELSGGASVNANRALLLNNARLAAEIAVALSER